VAVLTAPVTRGPLRSVIAATASIEASQQVMVAPRVAGPIAAIHVEVGANVKAGDALATLDAGTLPAQLQQARAAVLSANARFGQVQQGASSADLAAANSALLAAVNQQSAAQTALDALQARTDTATAASNAQAESDRMRTQRNTAQGTIDSTISGLTTNATSVRSAVNALDSAVSARCSQVGNREQCAVIATGPAASGGLAGLVKALNTGTPAVPTDFEPLLLQYDTDASSVKSLEFQEAVFRYVQAGAAQPASARVPTTRTCRWVAPPARPRPKRLQVPFVPAMPRAMPPRRPASGWRSYRADQRALIYWAAAPPRRARWLASP
jgi:multidrug efflux pump subunit AcrA (membrane-fusion protein)